MAADGTAQPLSAEDLDRLFRETFPTHRAEQRQARVAGLPPDALLWMALTPSWTSDLALACGFPSGGERVEDVLTRMEERGLVETTRRLTLPDEAPKAVVLEMKADARTSVLEEYREGTREITELRRTLAQIGRRVQKASGIEVLPSVRRWAALASGAEDTARMVHTLDIQVEGAAASVNPAEILDWIESARPLAALLARDRDPGMEEALQRASRRLELLYRLQSDRRHLQHFLRRDEQIAAFERLMRPENDCWALHYVGNGGVGKTMLVRYIAVVLAKEYDAITARIDFDYLSADYPTLAPGLLLWAFAQELRAQDPTGLATKLFSRADETLQVLHRNLRAGSQAGRTGRATDDPYFRRALRQYIEAFGTFNRRIVLIVDTCEELAKVRPDGVVPQNVEETFRILRALRDGPDTLDDENASAGGGIPDLRIVFSGRRLLAGSGAGWEAPPSPHPPRPYLRLHEIRGFTFDEARRYLADDLHTPPHLIDAVVKRSSSGEGRRADIVWHDPIERPKDDDSRCNPYDLRLYAAWAGETPPPSAQTIESATGDAYIEQRIIGRLESEAIERVLPAVALMGHVDRDTLRAVTDADDDTFDLLRQQEWINQRRASTASGGESQWVLEVEPGLRPRLVQYYDRHTNKVGEARRRAAQHLEERTLHRHNLGDLDWSIFDATLRVLEAEPERAALWWEHVEERILRERNFPWAIELLAPLLGADGAAGRAEDSRTGEAAPVSCMRPAVLATYASALFHTKSLTAALSTWYEVADTCSGYPLADRATRLRLRSLCGQIAVQHQSAVALDLDRVASLWGEVAQLSSSSLDPQLAAALVAATEAVVEQAEDLVAYEPGPARALIVPKSTPMSEAGPVTLAAILHRVVESWKDPDATSLVAFACSLAGRASCLIRAEADWNGAMQWMREALDLSKASPPVTTVWADWLPPDDIVARIRLEFIRVAYPAVLSPEQTLEELGDFASPMISVDGDRFSSAYLQLRLAMHDPASLSGPSPSSPPGTDVTNEPSVVADSVTPVAHRIFPPYEVVLSQAAAYGGAFDDTLTTLRRLSSASNALPLDTVRAADRALAEIILRMRLKDEGETAGTTLSSSRDLDDLVLLWTLQAVESPSDQRAGIPNMSATGKQWDRRAWLHAVWRTRYALDAESAVQALKIAEDIRAELGAPASGGYPSREFLDISLELDLREAYLVARRVDLPPPVRHDVMKTADVQSWRNVHPHQPEEALILWLRVLALKSSQESFLQPDELVVRDELVQRVGKRRAAEIAFGEGQLLAVRLPHLAPMLYELASFWFDHCDDHVGATITGIAYLLGERSRAPADQLPSQDVQRVRNSYNYMRERFGWGATPDAELPDWDHLRLIVPTAASLNALGPRWWRPWFVRLLLTLARPPVTPMLRAWIDEHYGTRVGDRIVLPAELTPWQGEKDIPGRQASGAVSRTLKYLTSLSGWVYFVAYLLIAVLAVILATLAFSASASKTTGAITVSYVIVNLVASVLFYGGMWLALRRYIASRGWITVTIQPGEAQQGSSPSSREVLPVVVQASHWLKPNWFVFRFRSIVKRGFSAGLQVPWLENYTYLRDALAGAADDLFTGLRKRLGRRSMEVRMEPQEGLHAPCWEAMIGLAAGYADLNPARQPFRFRRDVGRRAVRPVQRVKRAGVRTDAESIAGAGVTNEGLKAFRQSSRFQLLAPTVETLSSATSAPVRILHFIGTPRETHYGVGFQAPFTSPQQTDTESAQSAYTGLILTARELSFIYPELDVCLLQGEPSRSLSERFESDRRDSALMRVFAAEVFTQGVSVVIALPSLPPKLGAEVLQELARAIEQERRKGTKTVHEAVASVRRHIVEASDDDTSVGWEWALDVCLYCPAEWDGRLTSRRVWPF